MELGKISFSLSGGGAIPGNFQVGAVETIITETEIMPNHFTGVSVGAINAVNIVEILTKYGKERINLSTERWIRRVKSPEDIFKFPPYLKKIIVFEKLLKQQKPISKLEFYKFLWNNREMIDDFVSNIQQLLKSPSLFDNSPLIKMLDEELDMEAVMKSHIKIDVVVLSNEGELVTISNKDDISAEDFKKAIIASAALPIQAPPIRIGDKAYIDAGLLRSISISQAVHNLCNTVFIYQAKPSKKETVTDVETFMNMPFWQRISLYQALRSKDSMEITIERFRITNENIKKHENETQKNIEEITSYLNNVFNLEKHKQGIEVKEKIKEIIEKNSREAGYRFQKRHYVNEFAFEPSVDLPGNNLNFTSQDIIDGIQYGRDYMKRELTHLGFIKQ